MGSRWGREGRRRIRRLGVYFDGPCRLVRTPDGLRVSPDPADFPFFTIAAEVGGRFEGTTLFARTRGTEDDSGQPLLPPEVDLVELPFYERLTDLGGLIRAVPGTARGFWRGLGRVDAVWVLGPHPFAFLLVPLALLRRRRVVLGVRQDSRVYFGRRLPSERWKPAMVAARTWDLGYRALARRIPTTVVGPELGDQYRKNGAQLLVMIESQLRDEDLVRAPSSPDWDGEVTLFTVGRVDQEKNPLLLVEALAQLESESPGKYRLVWAGDGPLLDVVRRRVSELELDGRIELLGFVPFGPELLARYREAHAFVHVSLTEGVPATVVEAMGCGLPIVATAVGGVPFALGDGDSGLLVPPSDKAAVVAAIRRLEGDPVLRQTLATAALTRARGRTLDANAALVARFIDGRDDAGDLDESTVRHLPV